MEEVEQSPEQDVIRKKRKMATLSVKKKDIIEFLMSNDCLYSKQLAGFKDVARKEELWTTQAGKIKKKSAELKTCYGTQV